MSRSLFPNVFSWHMFVLKLCSNPLHSIPAAIQYAAHAAAVVFEYFASVNLAVNLIRVFSCSIKRLQRCAVHRVSHQYSFVILDSRQLRGISFAKFELCSFRIRGSTWFVPISTQLREYRTDISNDNNTEFASLEHTIPAQ